MKFLKGLTPSLLGLLLFLSLSIFGLGFTINGTILNPEFIRTEVEELDILALVQEFVNQPTGEIQNGAGGLPKELDTAVTDTVTQLEPLLREQITAATDLTYDYLLGKRASPDLAVILRSTILQKDFFIDIIDNLDVTFLAREILSEQLSSVQIPVQFQGYVDASYDNVVSDVKPIIKPQIEAAADSVLDYLAGVSDGFSIIIDVEQLTTSLRTALHDAVFASPPPEFALMTPELRESLFNQIFQDIAGEIQPTFEIDAASLFDTTDRVSIAGELAQAEKGLVQARQYIENFQFGYKLIAVLILLLMAGIILIHRQVRSVTRNLGAIFLGYGAFGYAVVLVGRYFANTQLPLALAGMPPSFQVWVLQLPGRLLLPMVVFSLTLLVGGVVLLVVSFVYRRSPDRASLPAI